MAAAYRCIDVIVGEGAASLPEVLNIAAAIGATAVAVKVGKTASASEVEGAVEVAQEHGQKGGVVALQALEEELSSEL